MGKKTTIIEVNEEPEIQLDAGSPALMAEIEAWLKARGGVHKKTVRDHVTYWDTRNFRLSREAIEYRVKGNGPEYRHDMKTPLDTRKRALTRDAHDVLWRTEHKCTSRLQTPALAMFFGVAALRPVADRVKKFFGKNLEMKCDAFLTKAKYDLDVSAKSRDTRIEYSFQTGNMLAMDGREKSRDLYIVELEHRHGSIKGLHEEYEALVEAFGNKGLKVLAIRKVFIGFQLLAPYMDEKQRRCFQEAWALNYGEVPDVSPAADPMPQAA